ncbi:MAG: hypothetical protein HY237_11615, partial [Acidobacteria bacterium]|nr:hypothetical protein [Acidobacteriota bacterium]
MAATATKLTRTPIRKKDPETRQESVASRLAELAAQGEWKLVEAGRTLHDDLGQVLTAAGMRFGLLAQGL